MTREDAIRLLTTKRAQPSTDYQMAEAYTMAIKALEQEPILDKIRAEIKKSSHGKWYIGRLDGKTEEVLLLDEVLQIIDKYRGESENT